MATSESDISSADFSDYTSDSSILIEEEEYENDVELENDDKLLPYKFEPYREDPAVETHTDTTATNESDNTNSTALSPDRLANTDW
jgi:hypothetical protein